MKNWITPDRSEYPSLSAAALGAAMGAATGHMGVWVAAGIAAYVAITLVARLGKRNLR